MDFIEYNSIKYEISYTRERQAVLFEEKVKQGLVSIDGSTTFEVYAEKWLETQQLAVSTRNRYKGLLKRINPAIGHIRLEKLKAHHLDTFYKNLAEDGVKEKGRYAISKNLDTVIADRKITRSKLATLAGILLIDSGARRGELCGLTWNDINFSDNTIDINKALQYQPGSGIMIVPTKNDSSQRVVKLSKWLMPILSDYKKWWYTERLKNGSMWQGSDDFLFIQKDGKPINPDTINFWLKQFREKHPELPYFTPHSLRHTFATLQITAGVDIRTLQARTGHAQASTLLNTYSHAIDSAKEAAADALSDMLRPSAM